jgi:hypothetical protein
MMGLLNFFRRRDIPAGGFRSFRNLGSRLLAGTKLSAARLTRERQCVERVQMIIVAGVEFDTSHRPNEKKISYDHW